MLVNTVRVHSIVNRKIIVAKIYLFLTYKKWMTKRQSTAIEMIQTIMNNNYWPGILLFSIGSTIYTIDPNFLTFSFDNDMLLLLLIYLIVNAIW